MSEFSVSASSVPITGATPEVTRAYLTNVAETIQNVLLPRLEGVARDRAFDCLRIVARLAVHLNPSTDAAALPYAPAKSGMDAALCEGKAIENVDAEARALLASIAAAPPVAARKFDSSLLESYLRQQPLGGPQLRIVDSRLLAGGRSKLTVLVRQEGAADMPAEFIVRQDWSDSVVGTFVHVEYEVLKRLYEHGIKVPRPLAVKKTRDSLGNPFVIVTPNKGKTCGDDQFVLPQSEKPMQQLAEQLGQVHAMDANEFLAMPGIVERDYTVSQLRTSLRDYSDIIARLGTPHSVMVDGALAWLEEHVEHTTSGPRSLVHGDLGFHNSLCDGDELCVILDWELVHVGHAAYDLGYLRNAIEDEGMWSRFMQAYVAAGGPQVESFLVDYFNLFARVWFYQLMLQARAGLCSGVLHDIELSVICANTAPRALAGMSRTLARCRAAYG